jgi:aminoglycoside phosphotransferase (APT) family kinase protein
VARTPPERTLDWVLGVIGAGARIVETRTLHGDEPPWQLRIEHSSGTTHAVLRIPTPPGINASMVATGAAALELAERHGLLAPRLIDADLQGDVAGVSATLETLVPGTTAWPATSSVERLRAAGAALARVHTVVMAPREHLPFRPRPIAVDHFAHARRKGWMPTTPLLQAADDVIRAHGLPLGETVFVHGDVWPGNLLWAGDEVAALVDWKTAGVGAPGVDVSELRKQVAIIFGPEAPDLVLEGWERATGTKAQDVSYWDAVAALNTRTELDDGYRSGGWAPLLDTAGATDRRDEFLRVALTNLGS